MEKEMKNQGNKKTPSWQYSIIAFAVIVLFIALGFALFRIDFAVYILADCRGICDAVRI